MNAREMHYDFKQKLNAIDSQKYRGLKVPEIDWKLNEAQEVIVKVIAQPRLKSQLGFEINQRVIDDIRTIVVDQKPGEGLAVADYGDNSYIATLPQDYWFYINSKVYATKGECKKVKLSVEEIQHDDEAELSPFDKSSFEWRKSNVRFNSQGIRIFTDGTYTIQEICMDYLRSPRVIHNAQDWIGGTYTTLAGDVLTGSSNCELPIGIHKEVVDLAVLITAGDLNLPSFGLKQKKIEITE